MNPINAASSGWNARQHFEAVFRKMGPGYASTVNGISHPLKVTAQVGQTVSGRSVEAVASGNSGRLVDTWA